MRKLSISLSSGSIIISVSWESITEASGTSTLIYHCLFRP